MRLAHLIFVHNNPMQLERLIRKIATGFSDIYIHIDKKIDKSEFDFLKIIPNVFFIENRISVNWANFTMVEAILCSLDEIVNLNKEYSHINFLSGQDYPLKNIFEFEKHLFNNPGKSFMQFISINKDLKDYKERLIKYNLGDWKIPFKYVIQDFINFVLPNRKIPNKLVPYGGSSWFSITPVAIKYVLEYLKNNPKVKQFFRYTWGADEIIFQTILFNSHLKDSIVNDNLRYIVFEEKSPNPKIFNLNDYDKLKASGKYFARKFSYNEDASILDLIDQNLIDLK